jgi:hypothetical protein
VIWSSGRLYQFLSGFRNNVLMLVDVPGICITEAASLFDVVVCHTVGPSTCGHPTTVGVVSVDIAALTLFPNLVHLIRLAVMTEEQCGSPHYGYKGSSRLEIMFSSCSDHMAAKTSWHPVAVARQKVGPDSALLRIP